jgi:ribosomal protein S12 methylthiotransferase accessory factor
MAGSAGTSLYPEEAAARANGELLERYSALNADVRGLTTTPTELSSRLPRCDIDEPCPPSFRSLDPRVALTHVEVERLADGARELLPAAYVHLGFLPTPPEPLVTMPISTGLAFRPALADAIWGGLCEVAERDAMMLSWWLRRGGREIDCADATAPDLLRRLDRLSAEGLTARLYDITTDFRVPTVYCVLTGPDFPHLTVGAACRDDALLACTKAMDEAVSIRVAVRGQGPSGGIPSYTDFSWVERLEDHSRLYAQPGMDHALGFMGNDGPVLSYAEFAASDFWSPPADLEELRAMARRLATCGSTVLWTEVTSEDVATLGHTVKVVVPEMVPLSQSHRARWLATPRLVASMSADQELNPYPHPFA